MKAYHGNEKWKSQIVELMEKGYVKNKPSTQFEPNLWLKDCVDITKPVRIEYKMGLPMLLVTTINLLAYRIPNSISHPTPVSVISSLETDKDYGEVIWDFLKWIVTDKLIPELDLDNTHHGKTRKLLNELLESFNGFDSHLVMRNNTDKLATRASINENYKSIKDINYTGSWIYRVVQNRYINPVDNIEGIYSAIYHTIRHFYINAPSQYNLTANNLYIEFYDKIQELIKDVDNRPNQ